MPTRQHEPNPHPAPHHPRRHAPSSSALRTPRARAGVDGIGADKVEMDLFKKKFTNDLEERRGEGYCQALRTSTSWSISGALGWVCGWAGRGWCGVAG